MFRSLLRWLSTQWFRIKESFWALPSALVLLGITLAFILPEVDRRYVMGASWTQNYLYGGNSDAAWALLSTIAALLATIVSISFSITIIALQQAAAQYSPRLLANFTRNHTNQLVLGTYIATVTYSLIVLRVVRSPGSATPGFVPALSISVALILSVISLALLVYFLHHISSNLQVSSILQLIRSELDRELRELYPEPFTAHEKDKTYAEAVKDSSVHQWGVQAQIYADGEGYLASVDLKSLISLAKEHSIHFVWLHLLPGTYLVKDSLLLRVWSPGALEKKTLARMRDALVLSPKRSTNQDALFGIRQIRDIAVKALSPGVNDPSTAEECINHLKGALSIVLQRNFPPPMEEKDGTPFLIRHPDLSQFLEACFSEIAWYARDNRWVLESIQQSLEDLIKLAPDTNTRKILSQYASQLDLDRGSALRIASR